MTNTPAEVSPTIDLTDFKQPSALREVPSFNSAGTGGRAVGAEDASKPGDVVGSVRADRGAVGLVPKFIGEFVTFDSWVNRATRYLTGHRGSVGEEVKPICVDTLGRRCHVGKDFMRARDEGTFPVRFFLECEPVAHATAPQQERTAPTSPPAEQSSSAVKALP